jgi:tripartite-type tricarboxylate transporter receptor subunit TctC
VRHPDVTALAVTSGKRLVHLPQVPTFAELGFKGLTAFTWFSLSAPRGLPSDVAQWASGALRRLYATESAQARIRQNGIGAVLLQQNEAVAFMHEEWRRWGTVMASFANK